MGIFATSAQTNMDYLTGPEMWIVPYDDLDGEYSFHRFHNNQVYIEMVFPKTSTFYNKVKWSTPFYLSDTFDEVFDQSKVGKSNTGRFLVESAGTSNPPNVSEIRAISASSITLFFDSRGRNTPDKGTTTLVAKSSSTIFVPAKPDYRLGGFAKGSGVWVDSVEPGMPIKTFRTGSWETVVCNLYNDYKAYSMALVTYPAANQPYFWQKKTTVVGWPDGLSNFGSNSDPYIHQFYKYADPNYYFIEKQLDNNTKALVFIGYDRTPGVMYYSSIDIVLLTYNEAYTVYSDHGHVSSFDFSSGNFSMTITPDKNATQKKNHKIYQVGGELWLQEL